MKNLILLMILCSSALFAQSERIAPILTSKIFLSRHIDFEFKKWTDIQGKVSTPPATWILLLRIANNEGESCLFYRENYEKMKGVLRLSSASECGELYDQPNYSLDHLEDLKMSFDERSGIILLSLTERGKERELQFLYPSFKVQKQSYNLLDDSSASGVLSYISLTSKAKERVQTLGKINDNYRDESAVQCHKVDDKCQDVTPNNCSTCAYGFFEVVDHHCPQGGSKYCGINRCGEQGQPACPRGEIAATRLLPPGEVLDWCSKESSAGFCQQGLTTSCDGNGVLICL